MSSELERQRSAESYPAEAIRQQLDLMLGDPVFRSSKRSIQFLRFVVEKTLDGAQDEIKERTIGVEIFGRDPSYDTAVDHVVRSAAAELRKRLSIYYGNEAHKSEIRMSLIPGSYVPQFVVSKPPDAALTGTEAAEAGLEKSGDPDYVPPQLKTSTKRKNTVYAAAAIVVIAALAGLTYRWLRPVDAEELFWKPLIDSPKSVLVAAGDIPSGPPRISNEDKNQPIPVIQRGPASNIPFADAVTIASVVLSLKTHGKEAMIRPEATSSFSDFKEQPVVLVGAFNNEWSLRLTQKLRFSLALDDERHLIYIRDSRKPDDRSWSQVTAKTIEEQELLRGGPARQDFALISRVWNQETGQVVVVVGGLYAYGTQAAGEFISDPRLLRSALKSLPADNPKANIQIVLRTSITDDTPGVPQVLAVSFE